MPKDPDFKLVKKDFFWDVKVVHMSNATDKNDVLCTLTLNTVDEFNQPSKIMVEMNKAELDKCIKTLKKKL